MKVLLRRSAFSRGRERALFRAGSALIGSAPGANIALLIAGRVFKIITPAILPATGAYLLRGKALDTQSERKRKRQKIRFGRAAARQRRKDNGMFREMRRKKQELSARETEEILERGTSGVLAVLGDDGYPYAVPVNYLYRGGKILFHGAGAGHKFDAMRRCDRVSFCVIGRDRVIPEKVTDDYRSAVAFGRVRILEDPDEKLRAARALGLKYAPADAVQADLDRSFRNVVMYEIAVEHLTGKRANGTE